MSAAAPSQPTMMRISLRSRVAAFLLLAATLAGGYIFLAWMPQHQHSDIEDHKRYVADHLVTIGDALLPYLIQDQIAAVHETLDATLARQPHWRRLALYNRDGKRLYPLGGGDTLTGPSIHHFTQAVTLYDQPFGHLELDLDLAPIERAMGRRNLTLALLFFGVFALAFLFTALFLDIVAGRPARQLAAAADRLAHGDYNATLPKPGGDEIGDLAHSFAAMRDNIQLKEASLIQAREAAESGSRSKSQFLANMSHEIRTPMNGVIGMLQLLANTPLEEDQRGYLETALHSADLQLTVINDILDFSKIEAGQLNLERIEFSLSREVEAAGALLSEQAHGKGLEFSTFIDPELPCCVLGDPTRVRQVLTNLIGNAVKFTEQGEIHVRVELTAEEEVVFSVHDSGIGIDRDTLDNLFSPFTQADASTTRRFGGTGLGLVISRQLVEAMGGVIGVDSRPGEGSHFHFTLPFEVSPTKCGIKRTDLSRLRFLVVDDNATNREIIERYLGSWNAPRESAADGGDALRILRDAHREGSPIDVVLLDMHMPMMDGLDVARGILQLSAEEPAFAAPRILMLTSGAHPGRRELEPLGIGLAIAKPIGPSRLLDAISTLLSEGEEVPEAPARATEMPAAAAGHTRVLLVEDNRVNQQVAMGMLRKLGVTVETAGNGREALEKLEAEAFDLVLMDVQMPEMDGLEATRRYRAEELRARRERLPIVALTAHALTGDREKCLEAGMDDYLAKPVQFEQLKGLIGRRFPSLNTGAAGVKASDEGVASDAERSASPTLEPELVERLRRDLSAIPGGFNQVIAAYINDGESAVQSLERAAADGDADALYRAAHSLKSQSATVGAATLSELSRQLELRGREGELEGAAERVAAIRAEFDGVLPELRALTEA